MGFFDWYLKCVKGHYADFEGRARRTEYWMFFLVNLLISIVLGLDRSAPSASRCSVRSTAWPCCCPRLAVGVRRSARYGAQGWWWLISLIPLIGTIWIIVLLAIPGDQGANQYGPDPKGGIA